MGRQGFCALCWQIFCRRIVYTDAFITDMSLFKIGLMKHIFLLISPASLFVCCLFPLWVSVLTPFISLIPFPSLCPSSEGEESGRFIKAAVGGGSQEKTSLTSLLPAHPRPLAGRPHRSRPPPAPPSPPRPLRFLSDGITGASRLLSDRERYGGHRAGASAQEVWLPGYQFPQVAPGNTCRQRSDGPPA